MSQEPALNRSLFSSARGDWNTPAGLLVKIARFDTIDVDPCHNALSLVSARCTYQLERGEDGLQLPWSLRGLTYVNPPYGREIGPWMERCSALGRAGLEIIALVPARTDAAWWQRNVSTADCVCFYRGRLVFDGAPASAPFPSALIYWGDRAKKFCRVFGSSGWLVSGVDSRTLLATDA